MITENTHFFAFVRCVLPCLHKFAACPGTWGQSIDASSLGGSQRQQGGGGGASASRGQEDWEKEADRQYHKVKRAFDTKRANTVDSSGRLSILSFPSRRLRGAAGRGGAARVFALLRFCGTHWICGRRRAVELSLALFP